MLRTSLTEVHAAVYSEILQFVQRLRFGECEYIVPTSQTCAKDVVQLFLHVCEHLRLNFSSQLLASIHDPDVKRARMLKWIIRNDIVVYHVA